MPRQRLADHVIVWDVMGPVITHPVACSALRKAVDCPHYVALNDGRVCHDGRLKKGTLYVSALLDNGMLYLLDDEPGAIVEARLAGVREFTAAATEEVVLGGIRD